MWTNDVHAKTELHVNVNMLFALARNPFFARHKAWLLPVILTSTVAYMQSNDWTKKEGVLDRIASEILKSQYQDVFWNVAYLVGGFDHQMAMADKYRLF